MALFAANVDAAVAVFDAHTGEGLGSPKPSWVAPKNASAALGMALLDDSGGPVAAGRYVQYRPFIVLYERGKI